MTGHGGSLGSGAVSYHPDRPILHWGLSEAPKPKPTESSLELPRGAA